jgi:hypothetical protein
VPPCGSPQPLPEKVMPPAEIIDRSNFVAWLVPWTSASAGMERRRSPAQRSRPFEAAAVML